MNGMIFVIAACLLWSVDALIRYPLLSSGVSSLNIVFYEHILVSLILLIFYYRHIQKFWRSEVSHIFYFILLGGLGSAYSTLFFTKAFVYANPSHVILLQKLQPIVAIVGARILLKEKIGKAFLIWAAVCFVGGGLISFEEIIVSINTISQNDFGAAKGYIFALIAVVGWGTATVIGKKLSLAGYNEKELMIGRFFMGFVTLLPTYIYAQESLLMSSKTYFKLSVMVILSGLFAMFLYYKGLKKLSAHRCAIAEMFFPLCAIIVNWIYLGKFLTISQILGGALLVIGATVIQIKRF